MSTIKTSHCALSKITYSVKNTNCPSLTEIEFPLIKFRKLEYIVPKHLIDKLFLCVSYNTKKIARRFEHTRQQHQLHAPHFGLGYRFIRFHLFYYYFVFSRSFCDIIKFHKKVSKYLRIFNAISWFFPKLLTEIHVRGGTFWIFFLTFLNQ